MKSKRIAFGLFMALFALNGCFQTSFIEEKTLVQIEPKPSEVKMIKERVNLEVLSEKPTQGVPGVEIREYDGRAGIPWIASLSDAGSPGRIVQDYDIVVDPFGSNSSTTAVAGTKRLVDSRPAIMQFGGSVSVGSFFYPKTTTYGFDCVGCGGAETGSGGAASGVRFNIDSGVQQSNGTWRQGITYDGYYIVAADRSIPIGTVLKISNHGYGGEGLTPGVPFYAKVLDRGGGIIGAHLDVYSGSEKAPSLSINRSAHNPIAEIVSVGNGSR